MATERKHRVEIKVQPGGCGQAGPQLSLLLDGADDDDNEGGLTYRCNACHQEYRTTYTGLDQRCPRCGALEYGSVQN
jgi:hypothetical protein